MTDFHTRSTARTLLNYSNQLATMLFDKAAKQGIDHRTDEFQNELDRVWKPAYDRALQFCRDNDIDPKYI